MKKVLKGAMMLAFLSLFWTNVYVEEVEIYGANPFYDSWGYILPESNQRYLTESDIKGLSLKEVNYAKNEIYARRGRKFLSVELQNYFDSKKWYEAVYEPEDFDTNYALAIMNNYEKVNADFLAAVEYSIDPNGYQLDSGMEEAQEENAPVSYDNILDEYKCAVNENFSNMGEYQYIPSYFDPYFAFYQGEKIYYAFYDFCDDGLPELLISAYKEATEYRDAEYVIADVYGTDGIMVQKLDGGYDGPFVTYYFCENNIMEAHWTSGGLSAGGSAYFRLYPNMATGEKIEEIGHTGYGECYRGGLENSDNSERIQAFEYEKIVESYSAIEGIPFEWQEIVGDM